jgi:hypothetical protein
VTTNADSGTHTGTQPSTTAEILPFSVAQATRFKLG